MYYKNFIIENGLILKNSEFIRYVGKLMGKYIIEIKEYKPIRTLNQNNFYWMYLNLIEDETGNNPNELHEFLKRKLLPPQFITVLGEEIKIPASTTKLSKVEMGEYMTKINALTGVPIPETEH